MQKDDKTTSFFDFGKSKTEDSAVKAGSSAVSADKLPVIEKKLTKAEVIAAESNIAFKNSIYKFKDGSSCTVVYDGADTNYITRNIS
jgi:lipopolysaccharide export system protein LptA